MSTKNILVVDDEPLVEYVIQQGFKREITEEKYHFTFASNGVEALEKVHSNHLVDVVLTDLNMPKMDGLTLLEELNELNEEIKTVVVSAYGNVEYTQAATNLGVCDFLVKPVDLHSLGKVLETQLYGKIPSYQGPPKTDDEAIAGFANNLEGLPTQELIRLYYHEKASGLSIKDAFAEALRLANKYQLTACSKTNRKPKQCKSSGENFWIN